MQAKEELPGLVDKRDEISKKIKDKFEASLLQDNVVEYYLSKSKEEIEEMFGPEVAIMVKYDQNNPHHCYDLFEHSLMVVKNISASGITKEELIKLKVAAFFHDVGKPTVVEEKNGRNGYYGHAKASAKIAAQILPKLGYTLEETDEILFYIEHHDDFIKFRLKGEDIWTKIEKE